MANWHWSGAKWHPSLVPLWALAQEPGKDAPAAGRGQGTWLGEGPLPRVGPSASF